MTLTTLQIGTKFYKETLPLSQGWDERCNYCCYYKQSEEASRHNNQHIVDDIWIKVIIFENKGSNIRLYTISQADTRLVNATGNVKLMAFIDGNQGHETFRYFT